jgi:RhoGAP domain
MQGLQAGLRLATNLLLPLSEDSDPQRLLAERDEKFPHIRAFGAPLFLLDEREAGDDARGGESECYSLLSPARPPPVLLCLMTILDVSGLESEGIFRVSGGLATVADALQSLEIAVAKAVQRCVAAGKLPVPAAEIDSYVRRVVEGRRERLRAALARQDEPDPPEVTSLRDLSEADFPPALREAMRLNRERAIVEQDEVLLAELETLTERFCGSEAGPMGTHVAAGLLKRWLRDLPDPVLTHALFDDFCGISDPDTELGGRGGGGGAGRQGSGGSEAQIARLRELATALPAAHQSVLVLLMLFLRRIAARSNSNKMTEQNLAVVIAPNILRSLAIESAFADLTNTTLSINTVRLMIHHYAEVFPDVEARLFEVQQRTAADLAAAPDADDDAAEGDSNAPSSGDAETAAASRSGPERNFFLRGRFFGLLGASPDAAASSEEQKEGGVDVAARSDLGPPISQRSSDSRSAPTGNLT